MFIGVNNVLCFSFLLDIKTNNVNNTDLQIVGVSNVYLILEISMPSPYRR